MTSVAEETDGLPSNVNLLSSIAPLANIVVAGLFKIVCRATSQPFQPELGAASQVNEFELWQSTTN